MSDDRRMRDVPMSDHDRELLRDELEGFDDMTPGEFRAALARWTDGMLDTVNALGGAA